MAGIVHELNGIRVFECAADEPAPRNDRDAVEMITEVWANRAQWIAIPVERLGDDFFDLKTRVAGEILQKFVGYKVRVAILGDVSRYVEASGSLRDFVRESNRGQDVWFVRNIGELEQRLVS